MSHLIPFDRKAYKTTEEFHEAWDKLCALTPSKEETCARIRRAQELFLEYQQKCLNEYDPTIQQAIEHCGDIIRELTKSGCKAYDLGYIDEKIRRLRGKIDDLAERPRRFSSNPGNPGKELQCEEGYLLPPDEQIELRERSFRTLEEFVRISSPAWRKFHVYPKYIAIVGSIAELKAMCPRRKDKFIRNTLLYMGGELNRKNLTYNHDELKKTFYNAIDTCHGKGANCIIDSIAPVSEQNRWLKKWAGINRCSDLDGEVYFVGNEKNTADFYNEVQSTQLLDEWNDKVSQLIAPFYPEIRVEIWYEGLTIPGVKREIDELQNSKPAIPGSNPGEALVSYWVLPVVVTVFVVALPIAGWVASQIEQQYMTNSI